MSQSNAAAAPTPKSNSRQRLIEAAIALMVRRDSIDITLLEIAAEAGLNGALVKYHFGNKDRLMLAVLFHITLPGLDSLEKLVRSHVSAKRKMEIHVHGMIAALWRYPFLNRLLRAITAAPDSIEAQDVSAKFTRPFLRYQRDIFEEGVNNGEFRQADPLLFYMLLSGMSEAILDLRPTLQQVYGIATITPELCAWYSRAVIGVIANGILTERDGALAIPPARFSAIREPALTTKMG
jgi:AcrR family transcriptional regulator